MNVARTTDENNRATYLHRAIYSPCAGRIRQVDAIITKLEGFSGRAAYPGVSAEQTMLGRFVQSIFSGACRPHGQRAARRRALAMRRAGSLAVAWLILACVGQAQDTAPEAGGRSATRLRLISNMQNLQPAAPAPAPADAVMPPPGSAAETVQPGVPATLQQDEQALAAGQVELPPIQSLKVNIQPPAGDLPDNTAAVMFAQKPTIIVPPAQPVPEMKYTGWPRISGVCYHPLYFEEPDAERYGITRPLQPVCSFVHFFGTIPLMPLKMVIQPKHDWVCSDRELPPSNRPWLRRHPIARTVAVAGQSGVYTAIFLLP